MPKTITFQPSEKVKARLAALEGWGLKSRYINEAIENYVKRAETLEELEARVTKLEEQVAEMVKKGQLQ
jgi:predicted DNA-binding protein